MKAMLIGLTLWGFFALPVVLAAWDWSLDGILWSLGVAIGLSVAMLIGLTLWGSFALPVVLAAWDWSLDGILWSLGVAIGLSVLAQLFGKNSV